MKYVLVMSKTKRPFMIGLDKKKQIVAMAERHIHLFW